MPKIPSVSIHIRITDQSGRRHYQRVKERNRQVCGPKDQYCLLYYDPKQTWQQLGQDYGEALNRRFAKQNELFAKAKAGANGENASTGTRKEAPATLEEFRTAFLAKKAKEKKKDRTLLDPDTIRAYEQLTQDFIYLTKCQFPGDVTGEKVNDWMDILEGGYTGRDGKVTSPPARARSTTSIPTYLCQRPHCPCPHP